MWHVKRHPTCKRSLANITCGESKISSHNNNNNDNDDDMSNSISQNKLSSVVLTAVQTNMSLVFCQKVCRETDAERMLADKLFHTRGPATTKLRVPSIVLVLGSIDHQQTEGAICPPQLWQACSRRTDMEVPAHVGTCRMVVT